VWGHGRLTAARSRQCAISGSERGSTIAATPINEQIFGVRHSGGTGNAVIVVLMSPEVMTWLRGTGDLVMLLDGFDEAYASLGKLPDQLVRLRRMRGRSPRSRSAMALLS
jgi:hypothetical protein